VRIGAKPTAAADAVLLLQLLLLLP